MCTHASSVNMFKNRIYKYLVKAGSRLALSIATCANGATNFSLAKQF